MVVKNRVRILEEQMGKFYIPEVVKVRKIPVVVYLCEGVENTLCMESGKWKEHTGDRLTKTEVREHLETLYMMNKFPWGKFNIDILWRKGISFMTDVWTFSNLDSWGSGALSTGMTFSGCSRDTAVGTSAEYGHVMLGREAEHRLFGGLNGGPMKLEEYLASRPQLPSQITNNQRYFI